LILGLSHYRFGAVALSLLCSIALAPTLAEAQAKAQPPSHADLATIRGHVHDLNAKPVANAVVALQATTGSDTETWNTRTDAAGSFRFEGVRAGSYTLRTGESGDSLTINKSVDLAAGEIKKIDLVLESAKPAAQELATKAPALFDEPQFTVAGVTQATNAGGHGSDTVLRNSEALVRDTASLGQQGKIAQRASSAEDGMLLQEGAEIQAEIVRQENASKTEGGAAENQTDDSKLDGNTRQKRAELYHRLAQIDERLGNPLEAVHEYQRAAELAPSETNIFDWGSELLTHRAFEAATVVFEKGSSLYPKSARMLIGLGVGWYARGSNERAAQYLASASDLAPSDPAPYLFMGKMESAETTVSRETADRLARFVRSAPENALASYYYAVALWKQSAGSVDDAGARRIESLLQAAIRLEPKFAAAHLQLGILYAQRGDDTKAVAEYQKAIEVSPDLAEAHYRLALAYKKMGDDAGAEKELKLHQQLAKLAEERATQEHGEIQEFVVKLRDK
jgi:Tfp pilus assembly protein PilF